MHGEGDAMVDYVSVSNFCEDAKCEICFLSLVVWEPYLLVDNLFISSSEQCEGFPLDISFTKIP